VSDGGRLTVRGTHGAERDGPTHLFLFCNPLVVELGTQRSGVAWNVEFDQASVPRRDRGKSQGQQLQVQTLNPETIPASRGATAASRRASSCRLKP
jgi:anti-sigma-K factor RskA